jgi:hypothetical protein
VVFQAAMATAPTGHGEPRSRYMRQDSIRNIEAATDCVPDAAPPSPLVFASKKIEASQVWALLRVRPWMYRRARQSSVWCLRPLVLRRVMLVAIATVLLLVGAYAVRTTREMKLYEAEYAQLVASLAALSGGMAIGPSAAGVQPGAVSLHAARYAAAARLSAEPKEQGGQAPPVAAYATQPVPTTWCTGADLQPPFTSACTVPVAMYAWNRADYLRRALGRLREINDAVMRLPGWPQHVPALQVVLSLDGAHPGVLSALHEELEGAPAGSPSRSPVRRIMIHPVESWHPNGHSLGYLNLKQHWGWMMGQLFDNVPELAGYDGPVLFLEEDMEPSLDALHVFRWLAGVAATECEDCWGGALSVGGFSDGAEPQPWLARVRAVHSNGGYFFNRTVWHAMRAQLSHFDAFPDGWDWAMVHMLQIGALPPRAAVPDLSRLRNFGTVGITVTERSYASSGLGNSPYSTATAEEFLAAAAGGQLALQLLPAADGGHSVGIEPLSAKASTPFQTIGKCHVCASRGMAAPVRGAEHSQLIMAGDV